MNRTSLFFRISLGHLQRLGPSIGADLQTDVHLTLLQQTLSIGEIREIPTRHDARLQVAVRLLELDTQAKYHDEGTGSMTIAFPEAPGNYTFQVPVVVTTRGREQAKSSLFLQSILLEISSDRELETLSGRIQDVHLEAGFDRHPGLGRLPYHFAKGNLLNRPAREWEFGGLMGMEGYGVRNGKRHFGGREMQIMTFQRDPQTGYVLESHFAPDQPGTTRVRQGLFKQDITPWDGPTATPPQIDAAFEFAFSKLPKVNPLASRDTFHLFAFMPARNWLAMNPKWRDKLNPDTGVWAILQMRGTEGDLLVFAEGEPRQVLVNGPIAGVNFPFSPLLTGFSSGIFAVGTKMLSAVIGASWSSYVAVTLAAVYVAIILFFLALLSAILELISASRHKMTAGLGTGKKFNKAMLRIFKLFGKLEASLKQLESEIASEANSSATIGKLNDLLAEGFAEVNDALQNLSKASSENPGLNESGFAEAFEDMKAYLDQARDWWESAKKK